MKLYFTGDVQDCEKGIAILAEDYGYSVDNSGIHISVTKSETNHICVKRDKNEGSIVYHEKIQFFRALGLFLQESKKSDTFDLEEDAMFTMNGAMFDVSQGNAVIRVNGIKDYLKRMAVMGMNMMMLYCEDSYEVKEQPYFGYMRSKYTEDELRECDDFAYDLGIEMIPCIQTLAHFIDVFKWDEYADMRDDQYTMLVGCEKSYKFVEDLIVAAMKPFRTKRIHIGMDEAMRLGLGNYLHEHGFRNKYDIMNEHLARVMEIVNKYGLKPMIWSDMYFRGVSKVNDYYDEKAIIPQEVADKVPDGVQLCYWDYYHLEKEYYADFLNRHRVFKEEPIFAGGIWTWIGYAPNWKQTFNTTNPALEACKEQNVKEVFVTIWGDCGTESNVFTNLLGLQLFAEHGYSKNLDMDKLKERFEFCTGANYDDFIKLENIDDVPRQNEIAPNRRCVEMATVNASKFLIWQDVLAGLFDKNIEGLPLDEHYEKLTAYFKDAKERNGRYNSIFELAYELCHALSIKASAGVKLYEAYKSGNNAVLKDYAEKKLPELLNRVKALRNCHKKQWYQINKTLGWDILDLHYGGLMTRISTSIEDLNAYLDGSLKHIEELEQERISYTSNGAFPEYAAYYGWIASASRVAPEA